MQCHDFAVACIDYLLFLWCCLAEYQSLVLVCSKILFQFVEYPVHCTNTLNVQYCHFFLLYVLFGKVNEWALFIKTQSILSPHKDVAHILSVARIDAEQLHKILKEVITKLEGAGLTVVAAMNETLLLTGKWWVFFCPRESLTSATHIQLTPGDPCLLL